MTLLEKVTEKFTSRKLWVAIAGMASAAIADQPILSSILGGVYVIVEGIVDAVSRKATSK